MKEEFLKYFPQHIQAILNEEDLNSIEEIIYFKKYARIPYTHIKNKLQMAT